MDLPTYPVQNLLNQWNLHNLPNGSHHVSRSSGDGRHRRLAPRRDERVPKKRRVTCLALHAGGHPGRTIDVFRQGALEKRAKAPGEKEAHLIWDDMFGPKEET